MLSSTYVCLVLGIVCWLSNAIKSILPTIYPASKCLVLHIWRRQKKRATYLHRSVQLVLMVIIDRYPTRFILILSSMHVNDTERLQFAASVNLKFVHKLQSAVRNFSVTIFDICSGWALLKLNPCNFHLVASIGFRADISHITLAWCQKDFPYRHLFNTCCERRLCMVH